MKTAHVLFCFTTMISTSAMAQWNPSTISTADAIYRSGNIGIGTLSGPTEKLEVNGRILSRMVNGGGWDAAFGVDIGNGLVVGRLNGNTLNSADMAHVLYRNNDGAIYRGYNISGLNTTAINSQNNGDSFFNTGGNVGIGTANPAGSRLHIADGLWGEQLKMTRGTGAVRFVQGQNQDRLVLFNGNGTIPFMSWFENGTVGINTSTPGAAQLYIKSSSSSAMKFEREGSVFGFEIGGSIFGLYDHSNLQYKWRTNAGNLLLVEGNGNVGIGTTTPNEKLTVNGTIYSKEVKVDLNVPGPDYVFEKDYNLPSLEEIKSYIDQHKHLPEVPSAKEMEANGINVGEMNMILLKKVEELTLHMIELKKENEEIKKQLTKKN